MLAHDLSDPPEHLVPVQPDELVAQRAAMIASLPDIPTPPDMTATLLSFQKTGLNWMMYQELGIFKGGVLADEMVQNKI